MFVFLNNFFNWSRLISYVTLQHLVSPGVTGNIAELTCGLLGKTE